MYGLSCCLNLILETQTRYLENTNVENQIQETNRMKYVKYSLLLRIFEEIKMLVVEPDYLPDSEVLSFSRVYTP
jgi:hypothetical protein